MLTCLFCRHFVLVVVEVLAAVQETELWIILLFVLGHFLELWAISSDKLGQFVNNVA